MVGKIEMDLLEGGDEYSGGGLWLGGPGGAGHYEHKRNAVGFISYS